MMQYFQILNPIQDFFFKEDENISITNIEKRKAWFLDVNILEKTRILKKILARIENEKILKERLRQLKEANENKFYKSYSDVKDFFPNRFFLI